MVKLTERTTGTTVELAKSSKRNMTKVITTDEKGAREMEITKAECRKMMADLFKSGWR
jgi:hypothetical protein